MSVTSNFTSKELQELCREFDVEELYLSGSAVSGTLSSDSDIDFLVNFERKGYHGAFDQFMDFKQHLEEIYGLPIDLYHQKKFRNSIFQRELDQSKELVYAA